MAREQAEEVDAEMVEEAPVLGRQHRLDQDGRAVSSSGIGVAVQDAALADLVAVAVEEGDGEYRPGLRQSLGGFLECRHGERQHHDRPTTPSVKPSQEIRPSCFLKP